MDKFIAIIDCLWHPSLAVRSILKEHGLYVYDMRSWDSGFGCTLEPVVVVNYEGSVVTNFEITNWDIVDSHGKCINNMDKWIEKNKIERKDFNPELEKQVKDIIFKIK